MRWYLLRLLFAVVGCFIALIIASWLLPNVSKATGWMLVLIAIIAGILYTAKGWPRPQRYGIHDEL